MLLNSRKCLSINCLVNITELTALDYTVSNVIYASPRTPLDSIVNHLVHICGLTPVGGVHIDLYP